MIYINDQTFGGIRVKNYKMLFTAKDTWLGPELPPKIPAVYNLWWDPGEQYDMTFNGAAPTRGVNASPGRYSGQDNGWIGIYVNPVLLHFFAESQDSSEHPIQALGSKPLADNTP
jgi:arylsulfatase